MEWVDEFNAGWVVVVWLWLWCGNGSVAVADVLWLWCAAMVSFVQLWQADGIVLG